MVDFGRSLRRSRHDQRLGGVAAGVAGYVGVSPTAMRIIWLMAIPATGGLALLAYFGLWLLLPEDDGQPVSYTDAHGARTLGIVLLAAGGFMLLSHLGVFHWFRFGFFLWPLALIVFGAIMLLRPRW